LRVDQASRRQWTRRPEQLREARRFQNRLVGINAVSTKVIMVSCDARLTSDAIRLAEGNRRIFSPRGFRLPDHSEQNNRTDRCNDGNESSHGLLPRALFSINDSIEDWLTTSM